MSYTLETPNQSIIYYQKLTDVFHYMIGKTIPQTAHLPIADSVLHNLRMCHFLASLVLWSNQLDPSFIVNIKVKSMSDEKEIQDLRNVSLLRLIKECSHHRRYC